jgi:hypothetical protein
MIVTRVLHDCPGCGYERYGNVMVMGSLVLRGCGRCKYSVRIPLPAIRKKILYLDQPFFSGAFRGGDQRFVDLASKIEHLSSQQLLTAPRSFAHDAEAVQWERGPQLIEFIKRTSRGHKFDEGYNVEKNQILNGFKAWLDDEPVEYVCDPNDALPHDLHQWNGYMFVDVRRPLGDPTEMREKKEKSAQMLIGLFDDWRQSQSTFEQDVASELAAIAKVYRDSYMDYVVRVGSGDFAALFDAPIFSMVIERMRHYLPADMDIREQLPKCAQFFQSQHFAALPYQYIRARSYAMLKKKVKQGAYVNRDRALAAVGGFFYDIDHIGHYAPYCDAIAMDQPMAELMRSPQIDLERRFGVKVFSLANLDEFHAWLDEIEAGITEEHRQGIADAYG